MISVIIPSYNREDSIAECINSILGQSIHDIEVIVVDDGSTDATKEVVNEICDPRVKYYYQDNQGACVARNLGVEVSNGDIIAFQDSDDIWHSDKLEKQLRILKKNPEIDIVCCQARCTREDGTSFIALGDMPSGIMSTERGPFGISTQMLVMRKEVFNHVRFDPVVTRFQDLDFMLTAMDYHKVYCIGEVLVERFISSNSITNNPDRVYKMSFYFHKKYQSHLCIKKVDAFFASKLIECADELKRHNINYSDYLYRAKELSPSLQTKIKMMLVSLNLYSFARNIGK